METVEKLQGKSIRNHHGAASNVLTTLCLVSTISRYLPTFLSPSLAPFLVDFLFFFLLVSLWLGFLCSHYGRFTLYDMCHTFQHYCTKRNLVVLLGYFCIFIRCEILYIRIDKKEILIICENLTWKKYYKRYKMFV